MLALTLKEGETVQIGDDIFITILKERWPYCRISWRSRIGIDAAKHIKIKRLKKFKSKRLSHSERH